MTQDDFKKQIERLCKTYGPERYPQERVELLWGEFRSIEAWIFEKVVSRLIGELATAPMIPKFREAAAEIREFYAARNATLNSSHATDAYRRLIQQPEKNTLFGEYVTNLVENKERNPEDFMWAVKVHGLEKLERVYEQTKKGRKKPNANL